MPAPIAICPCHIFMRFHTHLLCMCAIFIHISFQMLIMSKLICRSFFIWSTLCNLSIINKHICQICMLWCIFWVKTSCINLPWKSNYCASWQGFKLPFPKTHYSKLILSSSNCCSMWLHSTHLLCCIFAWATQNSTTS